MTTRINQYLIGNSAVVTVNITVNGTLTDPSTLQVIYENPDKSIITTAVYGVNPSLTRVSAGVYQITINLNMAGVWHYRWETTSPDTGAVESSIMVTPSIL